MGANIYKADHTIHLLVNSPDHTSCDKLPNTAEWCYLVVTHKRL